MPVFNPCSVCEITLTTMTKPEAQEAAKGVSLLNRMVYLDILELANAHAELTVEQAEAITACREAREDGVCAYFEE